MTKKLKFHGCQVKELPEDKRLRAALTAIEHNPANRPRVGMYMRAVGNIIKEEDIPEDLKEADVAQPEFLAVMTTKYWGAAGKELGVSFLEETRQDLRDRIISHMNAWYDQAKANVRFRYSQSGGEVRISRGRGGYWSYLGVDILHIAKGQQTMNLEGFTMSTPEDEYKRVVRHETGHTLGFPHEHMRRQIVARLDRQKTVAYFQRFQGWDANTTVQQVLTPLEDSSIRGTPDADDDSIMCYQLPAEVTVDGKPIPGGNDINELDAKFAASLYPLAVTQPSGGGIGTQLVLVIDAAGRKLTVPADWKTQQAG